MGDMSVYSPAFLNIVIYVRQQEAQAMNQYPGISCKEEKEQDRLPALGKGRR